MTAGAEGTSAFAPVPTPESAFFWDGLRERRLRLPYCTAGQHHFFPPMPGCPICGAGPDAIEHRDASGAGTVYSWIVAHYAFDPEFGADVPYGIVTVELDEGPRVYGRWAGVSPDTEIAAGQRVTATYLARGGDTVLGFAPAVDGAPDAR